MKPLLCSLDFSLRTLLLASLCLCLICVSFAEPAPGGPDSAGGVSTKATSPAPPFAGPTIAIPGPMRSFLRMAGISQKVSPDEVMPLLAREIFFLGYRSGRPTEFLVLLTRYVSQARELAALAGPQNVLRVSNCAEAASLLPILGYRIREACGQSNASLVTANAERAFLTTDSGFPLTELEQTIQGGAPFVYEYPSTSVPVLFTEDVWTAVKAGRNPDTRYLLDRLLRDPDLSLLYWAFSRIDVDTRESLRKSPGLGKLVPHAGVLNFYGSQITIRSGRVIVPGGTAGEAAWRDLVGNDPEKSGDFVLRLLAKDKGWVAAYYDALSRISFAQQSHFTDPHTLKRYYSAFKPRDSSAEAARGVFRPAPSLLLLVTRLQWDPDGRVHIPGGLPVWKEILSESSASRAVKKWARSAGHLETPEQLLEIMFSLSQAPTEGGPLQGFMCFSELDARRPPDRQLSADTVRLMANKFDDFGDQYLNFSEFPALDDTSITRFITIAESINGIRNHTLRGNAMGIFQANVGLWQILARQNQIPNEELNRSWLKVIEPFAKLDSAAELFNAGRTSLQEVLRAATGDSSRSQDEIITLLAGPEQKDVEGRKVHAEVADRMRSIMDSQRLVSIDTVLALGVGLDDMARGEGAADRIVPLAGQLREFEMPRPIFTGGERTQWAVGVYNNRHTDLEMKTDLVKAISGVKSKAQLEEARGLLVPFFRDTLVGLNYAYYEPPGAQVLRNNPLFVRSHDFSGDTVIGIEHVWRSPQMFGAGSPAGGGAHLIGSLADLPYVLAQVEQDFISPDHVQALIWREMVPGLLTNSILPRWWDVSRNELHAVALYQKAGEELLVGSSQDETLRAKVLPILSERMLPQRLQTVAHALSEHRTNDVFAVLTPADKFYLAAEFRRRYPNNTDAMHAAGHELDSMAREFSGEVSWNRISNDFGVPHPILTQSYARELLNLKPFPALSGFSSRLMAESWDSTNLYWARLADEMGYSPVTLNRLVPELTRRMVERIFATDTEDWVAVLRALQETGEELRQGKITATNLDVAPTQ